jgi:membrane protein required for beta-lactamase induction
MTLIKNLGLYSLPPLRRISSRDSKLQEEVGKWFLDIDVTHRVKLVCLSSKIRVLAVIILSCSEVLILMLEIWAITYEMPGLSTIVAQVGWKVSGLGNSLLVFLDEAEFLLLFLS